MSVDDDIIKNIYNELYAAMGNLKVREAQLVTRLNERFNTNKIRNIFYKYDKGFLMEWYRENDIDISEFKLEEIMELETFEQLEKYLSWNSIGSLE